MQSRPGETPQASGRRFEKFWAKVFGVEPQSGSGNQWHSKLDVADGSITFSCKWTSKESFSVSKAIMREAEQGVYENGDNSIPALAISVDNGAEVLVTLRASDFMRLLSTESPVILKPSRGDLKRQTSKVPGILREP